MGHITCGNCKKSHASVAEVRDCYKVATPVPAEAFKPAALAPKPVPESMYALDLPEIGVVFYEVKRPTKGKWAGFTFVDRLVGHPGDWMRYPIKGAAKAKVLADIAADPAAAAKRFADEYTCCAACRSPLTDEVSRARGLGPICAERFAS